MRKGLCKQMRRAILVLLVGISIVAGNIMPVNAGTEDILLDEDLLSLSDSEIILEDTDILLEKDNLLEESDLLVNDSVTDDFVIFDVFSDEDDISDLDSLLLFDDSIYDYEYEGVLNNQAELSLIPYASNNASSMTESEYTDRILQFIGENGYPKTVWSWGKYWDGDTTNKSGAAGVDVKKAWGCCAYAHDFAHYVFGKYAFSDNGDEFGTISDIRSGDVVKIRGDKKKDKNGRYILDEYGNYTYNDHYFCVLKRVNDKLWTAEGNYSKHVRIDYGYSISNGKLYQNGKECVFKSAWHLLSSEEKGHSPEGHLDSFGGGDGKIYVGGWAIDPDLPSKKIQINAYIEGYGDPVASFNTHIYRQIAGGTYSGFDEIIDVSSMDLSGTKKISLWAIDVTGNDNAEIGSAKIEFSKPGKSGSESPIGHIDSAGGNAEILYLGGWAYDPDATTEKVQVNVYVEGCRDPIASFDTHIYRQINGGTYCGFDEAIDISSMNLSGTKKIFLWAIDVTGNDNAEIGNAKIEFSKPGKSGSESPIGHIDSAGGNSEILYLGGWAYDPDATSEKVQINVYVEGCRDPIASFDTHIYRQIAGGTYCGFDEAIDISLMNLSGNRKFSLWAIDVTGNDNAEIGSAWINLK